MNYEASTHLSDTKFKRLVGVERQTFNEMLTCLEQAQASVYQKGGRKLKLSPADLLMATLQYLREYRTYEQIAADFNIHESNLIRKSHWVEGTLIQNGFHLQKQDIKDNDIVLIDVTEIKVNRPKKTKNQPTLD